MLVDPESPSGRRTRASRIRLHDIGRRGLQVAICALVPWCMVQLSGAEDLPPPPDLPCLQQKPADIEQCFIEFLETTPNDSRQWFSFIKAHEDQIYLNQETRQLRIFAAEAPPERVPYGGVPEGVDPEAPEALVLREEHHGFVEDKYLLSGGAINLLLLKPHIKGHSDVTDEILEADPYKFVKSSRTIVAEAAQDPDFYDWKTDAAHAQTPANAAGVPANPADLPNGDHSSRDFVTWVSKGVQGVRDFCRQNQLKFALYRLGYTLHAIQDLAAHKGRSAAEHSWNEGCRKSTCGKTIPEVDDEKNPDELVASIELAQSLTHRFLTLAAEKLPPGCWEEMRWYGGSGISVSDKLGSLLDLHWDLTPGALVEYRGYAATFAAAGPASARSIRWIRNGQDQDRLFAALAARLAEMPP